MNFDIRNEIKKTFYPYAVYINGSIFRGFKDYFKAKKIAKNSGGIVIEAVKNQFGDYETFGEYYNQIFHAPEETCHRFIVFDAENTPLDPIF